MAMGMAVLIMVAFLLVGMVCTCSPGRVQQAAKAAQRGTPWAGPLGKAFDTKAYVVMLRIVGVTSFAMAALLVAAMILLRLGYAEP
jgi:hypothetical protein